MCGIVHTYGRAAFRYERNRPSDGCFNIKDPSAYRKFGLGPIERGAHCAWPIGRRERREDARQFDARESLPQRNGPRQGLKPGQPRLLTVDNEMVVPVNKIVHVLVTSADVIHSFNVPSFDIKIDAVPGRINETSFKATSVGMFHSQCSALCGKDHSFMPIAVRVVSDRDFTT